MAMTGYAELRSNSKAEIIEFVEKHLDDLECRNLEIRGTENGAYIVEFFCSKEPPTGL